MPTPWELAPFLAWGGFDAARLDAIAAGLPKRARSDAVAWISGVLMVGELMQVLDSSTASISELVETIKAYTHMDRALEDELDVHTGLESTLTILQTKLVGMRVERAYDLELPRIRASGRELNQVWTNLIENAVEATNGHGLLRISTFRKGDQIVIEVADDGVGISDDIRPRIYEPFITTKTEGAGLGLGLNIAWRIVTEKYKDELDVVSQPGDTRFRVGLPLGASRADGEAVTGNGSP